MATQWYEEGRGDLSQFRRHVAEVITEEERLHQRFREYRALAERWRKRATLALSKELEALAREAVQRSQRYQELADEYRREYEAQGRRVNELQDALRAWESGSPARRLAPRTYRGAIRRSRERHGERAVAVANALLALEFDPIEARLANLEHDDRVDRQLAELKSRIAPTTTKKEPEV